MKKLIVWSILLLSSTSAIGISSADDFSELFNSLWMNTEENQVDQWFNALQDSLQTVDDETVNGVTLDMAKKAYLENDKLVMKILRANIARLLPRYEALIHRIMKEKQFIAHKAGGIYKSFFKEETNDKIKTRMYLDLLALDQDILNYIRQNNEYIAIYKKMWIKYQQIYNIDRAIYSLEERLSRKDLFGVQIPTYDKIIKNVRMFKARHTWPRYRKLNVLLDLVLNELEASKKDAVYLTAYNKNYQKFFADQLVSVFQNKSEYNKYIQWLTDLVKQSYNNF